MMFGRLLDWYMRYKFLEALASLAPKWNSVRCKIHSVSKSYALLYWQCYCMALEQWASAKLCMTVQGIELWNFRFS